MVEFILIVKTFQLIPISQEVFELFPWILCYIWKSRNRFVFENIREPSTKTLALTLQEAAVQKQANLKDNESFASITPSVINQSPSTLCSEYQFDASWHVDDTLSGHGWVLIRNNSVLHLCLKSGRRSLPSLHAKFDSLLWAIECMISIGDTSGAFASDCANLISILENQEEWPIFAAELASYHSLILSFPSFHIRFLPRNSNLELIVQLKTLGS